ncbi:hypothetical protein A33I_04085 [Alkalihalophilus marmarensis DSM 21297]|jgi:hypothetical protein|uniref:Uncharacterized protein n=1 Tax=Alkalihalophilus marmarensis DSM 21297 TaxID=1188261 RepID=U6SW38_9BACI|nr:hypothetical protein A33I_04085 [Alkalihalophilus marmarensis DSM 21297]
MVEGFVDYALGPHGRFLSEIYLQYQFPINTLIVGIATYKLFFTRKKKSAETH